MRLSLRVHEESVKDSEEVTVQFITVVRTAEGDEHEAEDDSRRTRLIVSTPQSVLDNVLNGDFSARTAKWFSYIKLYIKICTFDLTVHEESPDRIS